MSDDLPQLSRLSKLFKQTQLDFTMAGSMAQASITAIEGLKITPGPNMVKIPEVMDNMEQLKTDVKTGRKYGTPEFFQTAILVPYIDQTVCNLRGHVTDSHLFQCSGSI
jgi:hypothetical protein